jgi:hypothetical protein
MNRDNTVLWLKIIALSRFKKFDSILQAIQREYEQQIKQVVLTGMICKYIF